jgi:structural maintenance of chromosome 1
LNEAEEEADETRKESKRARDEFQELKKKRCDLFNKAFNHISGCIDTIYKDLTTSKTLKAGGTAQLYSDDAEVSQIWPGARGEDADKEPGAIPRGCPI